MKYYNSELEQAEMSDGQTVLMAVLNEVKEFINQSLKLVNQGN